MDSSNERKTDKKETIKLLSLRDEPGSETLYTKIPFFMRTRMELLIDQTDWRSIKQGCDRGDQNCLNQAVAVYYDLLNKIKEYLNLYSQTRRDAPTDDMMLMRTDLNFIKAEYGTDAVKFVKAMAECIEKEDELIDNYERKFWAIESAAVYNEKLSIDMMPPMNSPSTDPIEAEPQPEPIPEELTTIGNEIAMLKEALLHFQNGLKWPTFSENIEDIDPPMILLAEEDSSDQAGNVILSIFETLKDKMRAYVKTLENDVREWRTARAKASVGVGPKTDEIKLEKSFSVFSQHLKDLLSLFHNKDHIFKLRQTKTREVALIENEFEIIKKSLFHCNLVVYTEPKDLMSIESVGSRKGKDDKAGPTGGTKAKRRYCTKKKNSFKTEVRLLGGRHFQIQFQKCTIELVAEKDLAENNTGNSDQSSQLDYKVKTNDPEAPDSVVFDNVAIKSFSRVEQNHIYKQFFRLKYNLVFTVDDFPYDPSVLSQPFMFNTGSNQILELIAARMWYCANFDLYDGKFVCDDSLDVEVVLNMLDARVINLHPSRSRPLFPHEREFLRSRLPNSSNGQITMQGFIKDKMKKTRKTEEELTFPFHTWFYAVLNSIQTYLLKPWMDGVIFGFCSESQAKAILESQVVGTFIIRPSISRDINSMSSREANADLTIDIKMNNDNPGPDGEQTYYQSIPLLLSSVTKYTLYGAIAGIRKDNEPIAKYYLTNQMKRKNISYLRAYTKEKTKEETTKDTILDYGIITQKIEQLIITKDSGSGEAKCDGGPQRKRPFPNQTSMEVPPAPISNLPTIQQEVIDVEFQSIQVYNFDTVASGQGHRSGHQSNCLPVPNEVEPGNGHGAQEPGSSILRLDTGIEVDTSKLLPNFGVLQDPVELAAFLVQQRTEDADVFNLLECTIDPNSNVFQYNPQPSEITHSGNGFSSFQTSTTDYQHTSSRSIPTRTQYRRFNSNPPSIASTSTITSSTNWSPSHDDMSWNSPSDSGIDRDHTPSPTNEENCQLYPTQVNIIDLDSGNY